MIPRFKINEYIWFMPNAMQIEKMKVNKILIDGIENKITYNIGSAEYKKSESMCFKTKEELIEYLK